MPFGTRHPSIAQLAALSSEQQDRLFAGKVVEHGGMLYAWDRRRAAMVWGKAHGYRGELGGWIWKDGRTAAPVCQGWTTLADRCGRTIREWYLAEGRERNAA